MAIYDSTNDIYASQANLPEFVPKGGAAGQVLIKLSAVDGDSGWSNPTAADGANYRSSKTSLAAMAAIATPAIYILDSAVPVDGVVVMNRNTTILWETGGKFVRSGAGNLTVNGEIRAPRVKLFENFTKDNLIVSSRGKGFPEWWGSSGDGVTDDSIALQLMFDSFRQDFTNILKIWVGGKIDLGENIYYSTKGLTVNYKTVIDSPLGWIKTAGNTTGLRLNGISTEDGGAPAIPRSAEHSRIRCNLTSEIGADTHTVNLTTSQNATPGDPFNGRQEIRLTRTSGDVSNPRLGGGVFYNDANGGHTGVSVGWTVTLWRDPNYPNNRGWDWIIRTRVSDNEVILYPFRLYVEKNAPKTVYFSLPQTTPDLATRLVGAKLSFSDGTIRTVKTATLGGGATSLEFETADADFPDGFKGDCEIISLPNAAFTNQNVRFNKWAGIDARVQCEIDCYITNFNGHAVAMDSVASPTVSPGNAPNTNNSRVKIRAEENKGAGFMCSGVNSNHIELELDTANNALTCYIAGYLGIFIKFVHALFDRQGAWIGISHVIGNQNFGTTVNYGYVEGGSPTPLLAANCLWKEGDVGLSGRDFATAYYGAPNGAFFGGTHLFPSTDGLEINNYFKAELLHIVANRGRPPAIAPYRGMLWLQKGATGSPDIFQVLMKKTDGSYAWVNIASGV